MVMSGLRQWDELSAILFNLALEKIVLDTHETREING